MTPATALVEEAVARAGAPPPGDIPFLANLERLVESCSRTAGLNPVGRQVLEKAAVRHLRNLCELQAYVTTHPGVAARRPSGAVVVTGLPRTGTTLLHNLLAADPHHRVLRFWEALRPLPAEAGGAAPEVRVAQAERWLDAFSRLVPDFRRIHAATATGPEECDALLQNTFASQHFDDMFDARDYSAWLATAELTDEYAHYATQLAVLSPSPSPEDDRVWALKSPSHLGHLAELVAALPEATVVVCHRDPREAVPSYASLIHTLRRAYSDVASPAAAGRQALARAAANMARALDVRDRGPQHDGATFVDVAYRDLVDDPMRAVRSVYERAGRSLEADVEAAMRTWVEANPRHKHGAHRYGLGDFGLSEADVDAAFAGYAERFANVL